MSLSAAKLLTNSSTSPKELAGQPPKRAFAHLKNKKMRMTHILKARIDCGALRG